MRNDHTFDKPEEQETIQQMVYTLSHDLGSPLRTAAQFSELLQKRLADRLDDREAYWLQLIHEEAQRGQRMLNGLLDYSRLVTRRGEDMVFPLQDAIKDAWQGANGSHQNAQLNMSGDSLTLFAPYHYWYRYFAELFANSLKFQPEGQTAQITVRTDKETSFWQVEVADNGIGVDPKHWPELTRMYRRLNAPEDYPGVGMGLSLCERIIQLQKGELYFGASDPGGLLVGCRMPNTLLANVAEQE